MDIYELHSMMGATPLEKPDVGWKVTLTSDLPLDVKPEALLARLSDLAPNALAIEANYPWEDAAALRQWCSHQHDAVLQQTLDLARQSFANCAESVDVNTKTIAACVKQDTMVVALLAAFATTLHRSVKRFLALLQASLVLERAFRERGLQITPMALSPQHEALAKELMQGVPSLGLERKSTALRHQTPEEVDRIMLQVASEVTQDPTGDVDLDSATPIEQFLATFRVDAPVSKSGAGDDEPSNPMGSPPSTGLVH